MNAIKIYRSVFLTLFLILIIGCSAEQAPTQTGNQSSEPTAKKINEQIVNQSTETLAINTPAQKTETAPSTSRENENVANTGKTNSPTITKEPEPNTAKTTQPTIEKAIEEIPEPRTKKVVETTPVLKEEKAPEPENTQTNEPAPTPTKEVEPVVEPKIETTPTPKEEKPAIQIPDAKVIIEKVDKNMNSKTQIVTSDMVVYGKRKNTTISSKGYSEGNKKSFTEYLSPAREKGTKMLKLEDRLWIYSPDTDRTIQLSGHMLRQSVMGSDLSYEDMMEDRKLTEMYNAKVLEEETLDGRKTWKIELIAKVDDVAYYKIMIWIDQERYVPLKEEMYAKSGQILKKTTLSNIVKIGNRWYPKKINYKDMLSSGKGTDFIIKEIQFDAEIPAYLFTKGALKK